MPASLPISVDDMFLKKLLSGDHLTRVQWTYWLPAATLEKREIELALTKFDEIIANGASEAKMRGMALALKADILVQKAVSTVKQEEKEDLYKEAKALLEQAAVLKNPYAVFSLAHKFSENTHQKFWGYEKARRLGCPEALNPYLYHDTDVSLALSCMMKGKKEHNHYATVGYIYSLIRTACFCGLRENYNEAEKHLSEAIKLCFSEMKAGNPYAAKAAEYMYNKGLIGSIPEDPDAIILPATACRVQVKLDTYPRRDRLTPYQSLQYPILSGKTGSKASNISKIKDVSKLNNELDKAIKKLATYGKKLAKTSPEESKKAITLARQLQGLANDFIVNEDKTVKAGISYEFKTALKKGYDSVSTHRALWKPILLNILVAATIIGLVAIALELDRTGKGLFFDTKRGSTVKNIDRIFDQLDRKTFESEDKGAEYAKLGLDERLNRLH